MKEKAEKEKAEKKNSKNKKESGIVTKESLCATFALFSLLLFFILCTRDSVFLTLGSGIHAVLVGVVGYLSYPLVLGAFYLSVMGLFGKRLVKNRKIGWMIALTLVFLSLVIHIALSFTKLNESNYLSYCFTSGQAFPNCTFTGWMGGLIVLAVVSLISKIGAIVLFSLLTLLFGYITVILIKKSSQSKEEKVVSETEEKQSVAPVEIPVLQNNASLSTQSGSQQTVQQAPQINNALPKVAQRPGVSLYENGDNTQSSPNYNSFSPFGNGRPGNSGNSIEDSYERSSAFLFGGSPAENYRKNLLFDPNANVNKRSSSNSSAVNNNYVPSYSDAYQNSVNREEERSRPVKVVSDNTQNGGYFNNIYNGREERQERESMNTIPVTPLPTITEIPAPVAMEKDSPIQTVREEEPIRSTFVDAVPVREFAPPLVEEAERAETDRTEGYKRHDYMDLFSLSNPNIFGETEEDSAEEQAPLTSDSRTSMREEDTFRDGFNLLDEDEPEGAQRGYNFGGDGVEEVRDFTPTDRFSSRSDLGEESRDFMRRDFISNDREGREVSQPRFGREISMPEERFERERIVETKPISTPPKPRVIRPYVRVRLDDLDCRDIEPTANQMEVEETKANILSTLEDFKITDASIASVTFGPTVTRYNVTIPRHIAPKKVVALDQSIAISLHSSGVNVYPNYEDGVVSIEVPNKERQFVQLGCMLSGDTFVNAKSSSLMFAMGKDVANRKIYGDISKMIHLLVAGSSGSGKSVFLGALIISLIYKYSPEELRLILIDPKKTEFVLYNDLPHLMINEIITDVNKTIQSLNWAIGEMNRRYGLFEQMSRSGKYVVNLDQYNEQMEKKDRLPKIVIIIDELADLMLAAKKDIEDRIQNLTQKARAAGIHLIVATQRPSTDVITGVIKSNLPTRVAFYVATDVDSRVILDQSGAQKLLGKGDFLYTMPGLAAPARVQSAFISTEESQRVVNFIKNNNEAYYDEEATAFINSRGGNGGDDSGYSGGDADTDPKHIEALRYVIINGSASISMIQRRCSVGYNRAGKIVEWMEDKGYISPFEGAKSRKVLITKEQFESIYGPLQ